MNKGRTIFAQVMDQRMSRLPSHQQPELTITLPNFGVLALMLAAGVANRIVRCIGTSPV